MHLARTGFSTNSFCILELDRLPQLLDRMQVMPSSEQYARVMQDFGMLCMQTLSSEVSGVVVCPEHSFDTIVHKDHSAGLLLSLEQRLPAVDPFALPQLLPSWGVEHVRGNYGVAKLELHYNPYEEQAALKKQLVGELYHYCKMLDIDFVLELRISQLGGGGQLAKGSAEQQPNEQPNEQSNEQHEAQVVAISELRGSCDALALEYPGEVLRALTISAELDIPWLVSAREWRGSTAVREQDSYAQYKQVVRTALESGAAGCMVGESVFAELGQYSFEPVAEAKLEYHEWFAAVSEFVRTTARDRVIELARIVREV